MNGYLLDTHVWLWVQQSEAKKLDSDLLSDLEKLQRQRLLYVSAISILEIARLVALNQYALASTIEDFVAEGVADDGFVMLDLTPRILIESTRLPGTLHRDPSDRLLAATAREHGLTLITRDRDLLAYARQGHLKARKP
jgi:PIN domain nuclease of toxin-antitoxin system